MEIDSDIAVSIASGVLIRRIRAFWVSSLKGPPLRSLISLGEFVYLRYMILWPYYAYGIVGIMRRRRLEVGSSEVGRFHEAPAGLLFLLGLMWEPSGRLGICLRSYSGPCSGLRYIP